MHTRIRSLLLLLVLAFGTARAQFPGVGGRGDPAPSRDSVASGILAKTPATQVSAAHSSSGAKASGAIELIFGILLVPVGFIINVASSFPECEEPDAGEIMQFSVGPCSKGGPSAAGQGAGAGLMLAGGVMIVDGSRRLIEKD
jgi:hypothetical protein